MKFTVEENCKFFFPILSIIIFCGTNDLALCRRDSKKGNVQQLYDFHVEAGDNILKSHLETAAPKARYTSHHMQDELIKINEEQLRKEIVFAVNNSIGFSIPVLTDETSDISGKEQLSIGNRFVETDSNTIIREEFLGLTLLEDMSTSAIADSIINQCKKFGINLKKIIGTKL